MVVVIVDFDIPFFGEEDKVSGDTSCGGVKLLTGDEYHRIEELTSWPLKLSCHILVSEYTEIVLTKAISTLLTEL